MKVRWGILGPGRISHKITRAITESPNAVPVAVASRTLVKAQEFASKYQLAKAYGCYEELLEDREVQAVYISLPNHLHAEWTIRAAEAGKSVLCEKPFTMNMAEARQVFDRVRSKGVLLAEAFMYQSNPQTKKLREVLMDGILGPLASIQSHFHYRLDRPGDVRLIKEFGGGSLMDIGCYAMSISRLVAGAAMKQTFAEPLEIMGAGRFFAEHGVDSTAAALLKFPGNLVAQISSSFESEFSRELRIHGPKGMLLLTSPWAPQKSSQFLLVRGGKTEPLVFPTPYSVEVQQIQRVSECILEGRTEVPEMTWEDTLGNMNALDRWRKAIGLHFDSDLSK
jgi:predicted dehydrogenase